jgi:DNA uptake protein ComE-like DNA-binding protein
VSDEVKQPRSLTAPLMALAGVALALWLCAVMWAGWSGCSEAPQARAALPAARIDINTADAGTLEVLPSIGPAISQRIVSDRQTNGPYERPADLLRVKGVTEELLRRIEPFVCGFTGDANAAGAGGDR